MWVSDGALSWGVREPARVALASGERAMAYGELRERVLRVAAGVAKELDGVRGQPVAIQVADPFEFLVAFLGVVDAGAIATPLAAHWNSREREAGLAACPPALVIADEPWAAECPVVTLDEVGAAGARGLVSATPNEIGPMAPAVPDGRATYAERGSEAPFYVGFSSGSTGAPKAIVRQHGTWLNSFLAMSIELGVGPGTTVAVPGTLFFSFSLIAALQALYVGATLHLPEAPGVDATLRSFEREVEVAYVLPSILGDAVRRATERRKTYPGVRRIICAGEKLPDAARDAAAVPFPNAEVVEYYGASELGFVTIMRPREAATRPGSVGRPFLGSELAILDATGAQLPTGEVGLVCARTEYGFAGYYGDTAGTARLDHHGWQTVGDLGRLDEDGFLYLAGRRDTMVVIRGENIIVEEVERVLLQVPGVRTAAVIAEPVERPTHLVAFVVAPGGDRRAIREALANRLTGHALPRRVELVDAIPLTATGKVARADLARGGGDAG